MIGTRATLGMVLAGLTGMALSSPGVGRVAGEPGDLVESAPVDFEGRVEALKAQKPVALTLYHDEVDREGAFEPERIITSSFSQVCKVDSAEIPRVLQGLELLRPIDDGEQASANVNMALVFTDAEGKTTKIFFFYPVPRVPIDAIFGGAPYRASSDFPKLVVKLARKSCGAHWPFSTDLGD